MYTVETENITSNEVSNKEKSFSLLDRCDEKITSGCINDVEMNYEETIGCLDVNLDKHLSHVEIPGEERIACLSAASASENIEMETEKSLDCDSLTEKVVDNKVSPLSCEMIDEDIPNSEGNAINSCQEKDIICDEEMKDTQVELGDVTNMNESVDGKELVPDEEMADLEAEDGTGTAKLNESIEETRITDLNESLHEMVNKENMYERSESIEVNMEEEAIGVESLIISVNDETDKETVSKDNVTEIEMEKDASPMDVDSLSCEENLEIDGEPKSDSSLQHDHQADENESTVNGKVDEEFREDSVNSLIIERNIRIADLNNSDISGNEDVNTQNITESCSALPHQDYQKNDIERISEIESTAKASEQLIHGKQDSTVLKNTQISEQVHSSQIENDNLIEKAGNNDLNKGQLNEVVLRITEKEDATPLHKIVTETNETISLMEVDPNQQSLSTENNFLQDNGSNGNIDIPSKIINNQELDGLNQPVTTSTPRIQDECAEEENSDSNKSDPDFADFSADEEDDEESDISKRKPKRRAVLKRRAKVTKIDKSKAEPTSKASYTIEKFKKKKSEDVTHPRFKLPLLNGWVRELVFRNKLLAIQSRIADVYYYTPSGKKLRSTIEVKKHLTKGLTMENFTFAKESIGINDNLREIVRDARVKNGSTPSDPTPVVSQVGASNLSKQVTVATLNLDSTSKTSSSIQPSITSEVNAHPHPPSSVLAIDNNDDIETDIVQEENFEVENEFEEDYMLSSEYEEDPGDGGPNESLVRKYKCSLKCSKALNLIPTILCCKCYLKYHIECEDIKTEAAEEEDLPEIIDYICKSCRLKMIKSSAALEPSLPLLPSHPKLRPIVNFSRPLVPTVKVPVSSVEEVTIGNKECSSVEIEDYWESDSDISYSTTNSESNYFDDLVIEENDYKFKDNAKNEHKRNKGVVNNVTESMVVDLNSTKMEDPNTDKQLEEQIIENEVEPDEEVENDLTETTVVDLNNIRMEDPSTDKQIEQIMENEVEPDAEVENNFTETTVEDLNNTRIEDPSTDKQIEQIMENEVEPDEEVENNFTETMVVDLSNTRMEDPSTDKQIEQIMENVVEPDEEVENNFTETTVIDLNNTSMEDPSTDKQIEQIMENEVKPDEEVESNFTEITVVDLNNTRMEDPSTDKQIEQTMENEVEPDVEVENNFSEITADLNNTRIEDPGSDKQIQGYVTERKVVPDVEVENNFTENTAVDLNSTRLEDPSIDKQTEELLLQRRKGEEYEVREIGKEEETMIKNEQEHEEKDRSSFSGTPIEFSGEMYQCDEASERIEQFLASSQYLEDYNILRSQMPKNIKRSLGEIPRKVSTSRALNNTEDNSVIPFAQIILPGNPSIIAENVKGKRIPLALREPLITAPVDELTDTVQESSLNDPLATNVSQTRVGDTYPNCQSNDLFISKDNVRTALRNKLEKTLPHDKTYPDVIKASSSNDDTAVKKARNMKEPCNCKLSKTTNIFKCNLLTEQDRAYIYNKFWTMNSWKKKKTFVTKLVEKRSTMHHPFSLADSPEKLYDTGNTIFYLMKGGWRLRVCRKMFMNTLGIGDWSLSNWLKNLR